METYYNTLLNHLEDYTVLGLFDGKRRIEDIVTLQTGHQGRVFFFDQEPMIKGVDDKLWDYIFQEPTIFANSELDSADKAYVKEKYPNFVDWYYFSHGLVSREWLLDYQYRYAGWSDNKKCLLDANLITGFRQYRIYLLYLLLKKDSVGYEFNHISFNGSVDWVEDLKKFDHLELLKINDLVEVINGYNNSYDNFAKNNIKNRLKQQYVSLDHYSQSNLILVAETVFSENKKHLTEKIFKPISTGKPFVLAGGYHNLQYIKKYGFKTFDVCWNEDYDNIRDPKTRAQEIINLIDDISLPKFERYSDGRIDIELYPVHVNERLKKLKYAHDIAADNRKYFWSNEFYNLLINEAVENLERAKLELASKRV